MEPGSSFTLDQGRKVSHNMSSWPVAFRFIFKDLLIIPLSSFPLFYFKVALHWASLMCHTVGFLVVVSVSFQSHKN